MTAGNWLTAAQTASLLRIGRTRLRLCGLPFVQVGHRRFYHRADVYAYEATARTNRRAATARRNFTTHGLSSHELYETWRGMMDRCHYGRSPRFECYGAAGIEVYAPWHDLATFIHDIEALLGPRPRGKTLDRIDGDGNYEPGNLRWATWEEQAANRGGVRDRAHCLCIFDCSSVPGLCPLQEIPWATVAAALHERRRRAREALVIPPLVMHVHTGRHSDCFACLAQDPFSVLAADVWSAHEHCAAAAGYSHRAHAPLGLFGL